MKILTRDEAQARKLKRYFTGKPCRHGHAAERFVSSFGCVVCALARNQTEEKRAYLRRWYDTDRTTPEGRIKRNEISARWRAEHPEQFKEINKAWCVANPDKVLAKNKRRIEKRDQYNGAHREWLKQNPGYMTQHAIRRKKLIDHQQTPPWADRVKIADIYANRPAGYHVDHIVPLKGRTVCGLHCEANLTYLPGTENNNKYNNWPSDAAWVFHRNGRPTPLLDVRP